MKVLATGGTGFIGSKVVDLLVEVATASASFLRPDLPAQRVGKDVSLFHDNLQDTDSVIVAMSDKDLFYHIGELAVVDNAKTRRILDWESQFTLEKGVEEMVR